MNNTYRLGTLGGLQLLAKGSAFVGFALLVVILALIGMAGLNLSLIEAALGAVAAAALHYVAEYLHNFGHALGAKRSGYPMTGIMFWWVLGRSLYPRDEGELPATVHIQRALAGPLFSAVITMIGAVFAWALSAAGGVAFYVAAFFALDNLLVFTLGAFLPLGFTDGSTLLYWLPRRQK
jgi:hypothetical protein